MKIKSIITGDFKDCYLDVLTTKYAQANGRARRKEYWLFVFFNFMVGTALNIIEAEIFGTPYLFLFYTLYTIIPLVCVSIRRLHDTGKSGFWFLLTLIPVIGTLTYIIFLLCNSQPGDNKYGPNPKE